MLHPYREGALSPDPHEHAPSAPPCLGCRLRAVLARFDIRLLFLCVVLVLMLGANTATAIASLANLREARLALTRSQSLDKKTQDSIEHWKKLSLAPKAQPPPPPAPCVDARADGTDGIFRVDSREYYVKRSSIDKALERSASGLGPVRVLPYKRFGVVRGVQVFGMDANSILGMLGFEDGDVIESINGFDVATPDHALEAYARLRSANELSVRIGRRGTTLDLHYHVLA